MQKVSVFGRFGMKIGLFEEKMVHLKVLTLRNGVTSHELC